MIYWNGTFSQEIFEKISTKVQYPEKNIKKWPKIFFSKKIFFFQKILIPPIFSPIVVKFGLSNRKNKDFRPKKRKIRKKLFFIFLQGFSRFFDHNFWSNGPNLIKFVSFEPEKFFLQYYTKFVILLKKKVLWQILAKNFCCSY